MCTFLCLILNTTIILFPLICRKHMLTSIIQQQSARITTAPLWGLMLWSERKCWLWLSAKITYMSKQREGMQTLFTWDIKDFLQIRLSSDVLWSSHPCLCLLFAMYGCISLAHPPAKKKCIYLLLIISFIYLFWPQSDIGKEASAALVWLPLCHHGKAATQTNGLKADQMALLYAVCQGNKAWVLSLSPSRRTLRFAIYLAWEFIFCELISDLHHIWTSGECNVLSDSGLQVKIQQ